MTKTLVLASGLTFVLAGASFASTTYEGFIAPPSTMTEAVDARINNVSLANDRTSPVPLPAAGWMLLAGLGGIAVLRRRAKA
jgi:hypothetical protein